MWMQGKVALITGAASGIGRATALLFAREGARVSVADIDAQGSEEAVSRIAALGGHAMFAHADATKGQQVKAAVEQTVKRFGRLDALVNCVGIGSRRPEASQASVIDLEEEDWDTVMAVNLKSVFLYCKYAVPELIKTEGTIVSIASVAGMRGLRAHPYGASKAGIIQLTRTLAIELAPYNVRVNCVSPGFIDTPLMRGRHRSLQEQEETVKKRALEHPLGRIGKPEEIAETLLWLSSPRSSFVTGQCLPVDGGYTAK